MNKKIFTYFGIACFVTCVFYSCTNKEDGNNKLSDIEKQEGWSLLFDGESTSGWHLYNGGKIDSQWLAKDGELYCKTLLEHQDIVTDKEFENFDMTFEWKMAKGGNSGVFINVIERKDLPSAWSSGPEYQLLENSNPDYATGNKRSGCIFGFDPQINSVALKPLGEWNQSRIRQQNGKIEFYLNGVLTAHQDLTSKEWIARAGSGGFKYYPEYGRHTKGHIGLQYWLKGISFRNMKIKEI